MLNNLRRKITIRALSASCRARTELALAGASPDLKRVRSKNVCYSIRELYFDKFLILLIDGDLKSLIKDHKDITYPHKPYGKEEVLELCKAKEEVMQQWADGLGKESGEAHLRIIIDIYKLESKLERIQSIVDSLQYKYNTDLVNDLKALGIRRPIREAHLKDDLRLVVSESKRFVLELDKKCKALENMQVKSEPPTYETYDNILTQVDPKLRPDEITTERFLTLYNGLRRKIKALEKHGSRTDK